MKKIIIAAIALLASSAAQAETYRLIHAIGNEEKEVARDLSKNDCEARKSELKAVSKALGAGNPQLGAGSITCLPESYF